MASVLDEVRRISQRLNNQAGGLVGRADRFVSPVFSPQAGQARRQFVAQNIVRPIQQKITKPLSQTPIASFLPSGAPLRQIKQFFPQAKLGPTVGQTYNFLDQGPQVRRFMEAATQGRSRDAITQGIQLIPAIGLTGPKKKFISKGLGNLLKTIKVGIPEVKERGFITTVKEARATAPKIVQQIEGTYIPISSKQTVKFASQQVKQGYDIAKQRVFTEPLTRETNAIGQEIMKQAQRAGRYDEAIEVAEHLAVKGTQAGQTIQAFSIWSRLTPQGMLRYATRQVQQANAKMGAVSKVARKVFGVGPTRIEAQDANQITRFMNAANKAKTDEQSAYYVKRAMDVISKKIPWGISDALDEYRYANMLSNPITHLRNAYSNLIQTFFTRPATLAIEGNIKGAAKYELAAIKAIPEAMSNFARTLKGGQVSQRLDILSETALTTPRVLGRYNLPSQTLEAEDQFFSTLIKEGELARGVTLQEAENIASYTLFRQGLKPQHQGILLNKIDDLTKGVYQLRKVGLGWFIPFIRTPMNVAKQWIEYSPFGLATIPGASNAKEQLAKTALGTIATLYGAHMALEGRTTWQAPIDPTAKKLFYDLGKKPFSVKIGNKWVPMQYLGVYAWAAGLGAAYKYYNDESPKALTDSQIEKLTKTVLSIGNQFSQQTFVSGLGSFVRLAQGDIDYNWKKNLAFAAGQLKPFEGTMRYIATIVDPVFRRPETLGEAFRADLPGLTKDIPPYETFTGEPAKRNITNYIAPYAVGFENPQYQNMYQERVERLQSNAVLNKAEKELQRSNGQIQVGSIFMFMENGKVRRIDKNFEPKQPELTGHPNIDKERLKDYVLEINKKMSNIKDLVQEGEMTTEEAEGQLARYNFIKTNITLKVRRPRQRIIKSKGKRLKVKKTSFKKFRVKARKTKALKIPRFKGVVKSRGIRPIKIKRLRVKI